MFMLDTNDNVKLGYSLFLDKLKWHKAFWVSYVTEILHVNMFLLHVPNLCEFVEYKMYLII